MDRKRQLHRKFVELHRKFVDYYSRSFGFARIVRRCGGPVQYIYVMFNATECIFNLIDMFFLSV